MKSNKNLELQYSEDIKCRELPYNHEETLKLDKSPIYIRYKQWLKDNGVTMDARLRYPSYFGEPGKGVVGISACKPIEKRRAIISVPYNLLITVDKVKLEYELYEIVKQNVHFFKSDDDAAMKLLVLYISCQLLKGEKSFYYPYFSISADAFMNGWDGKALHVLENRDLVRAIRDHKESMQLEFMNFLRIFRRYEKLFPQNLSNHDYKAIYQRSYTFITTRAFGWSLPSISLIPLADSLNHSNIRYVNHFVINIDQEKSLKNKELINEGGYRGYKEEVNLAILRDEYFGLSEQQLSELRKEKKSKPLKFVEKHKDILLSSMKLEGKECDIVLNMRNKQQIRDRQYHILHQQYKAGIHKLKNLHFYQSSCDEDNDTDQDQIFDREMNNEKFVLYDRSRLLDDGNKKKEIGKLWKNFLELSEDEEQQNEENPVELAKKQEREGLKQEIQEKLLKGEDSSEVSYEDSEDEEDPVWDWTAQADKKKTYFIMSTKSIIRQNEQIYNFYGRRSNKFLLTNYNFILQDNIYDSYCLRIRLDDKLVLRVPASKLLVFKQKEQEKRSRQIRLKKCLINEDLISICRSYVILWTKKEWKNCRLTVPFDRDIELKTLELYQEIIKSILKEYSTTEDEDQEEEAENKKISYEQRTALLLRQEYKKILRGQEGLIARCINYAKKWQVKGVQNFEEADMKWVRRLKPYLLCLQSSTTL